MYAKHSPTVDTTTSRSCFAFDSDFLKGLEYEPTIFSYWNESKNRINVSRYIDEVIAKPGSYTPRPTPPPDAPNTKSYGLPKIESRECIVRAVSPIPLLESSFRGQSPARGAALHVQEAMEMTGSAERHDGQDSSAPSPCAAYLTPVPSYTRVPPSLLQFENGDKVYESENSPGRGNAGETNPEEGRSNKASSYPEQLSVAQGHQMSSLPQSGCGIAEEVNTKPSSAMRFQCRYCSKKFFTYKGLKGHLLRHKQEKYSKCDSCEARFGRLHELIEHTKLHTGKRPHVCPKCDRCFARGDALARHNTEQGGCPGRRSSIGNPDDDKNCAERMGTGSEDKSLPDSLDDALVGGKPPPPLQAPITSYHMPPVTPAVPGIPGLGSQLTMASSVATVSTEVERENETDWSLGKERSLLSHDNMSLVKCQVLDELLRYKPPTESNVLHRQPDSFHVTACVTMEWDPRGFINSQYPDSEDANLGSVIILNRTVLHSQATTASEYAHRTWPSQGLKVLAAFESAIGSGEGRASGSDPLVFRITKNPLHVLI